MKEEKRNAHIVILKSIFYTLLSLTTCFAPIWLATTHSSWISGTYGPPSRFELFGFMGATSLLIIGTIELRGRLRKERAWQESLPVLIPLFVALHFLTYMSEHSEKKYDYECYEAAASQVLDGRNPYAQRPPHLLYGKLHPYFYPPLTAQIFADAYRLVENAPELSGWRESARGSRSDSRTAIFNSVFYYYRCAQFLLVLLTYYLCYVIARKLGIPAIQAHVLIAGLMLFNNPLFRTIRWSQVNLWVLDLGLIGILLAPHAAPIAGFSIALAGHIKLYPLVLLAVLAGARYWAAAAWTVAGFGFILFLQTGFDDFTLWEQFITFFSGLSWETQLAFRNNSVQSIVYNSVRLLGGVSPAEYRSAIRGITTVLSAMVSAWFLYRFAVREKQFRTRVNDLDAEENRATGTTATRSLAAARLIAHGADALAFGLLVSPSAWEHHYVLAMPLVIWTIAMRGRARPWIVGTGVLLTLVVPTFDVFPLSYHRIVGLLLLLIAASPRILRPAGL